MKLLLKIALYCLQCLMTILNQTNNLGVASFFKQHPWLTRHEDRLNKKQIMVFQNIFVRNSQTFKRQRSIQVQLVKISQIILKVAAKTHVLCMM